MIEEASWLIGVDPGLSGGLAFFRFNPGESDFMPELVGARHMPVMANPSGKGQTVDCYSLAQMLAPFHGKTQLMIIEQVGPMPNDSRPAAFKFGKAAMAPEALAAVYQLPVRFITPGSWKRKAGLIKKPKDASRTLAITMWPNQAELFKLKKQEGMAEAALIAHFGYKKFNE